MKAKWLSDLNRHAASGDDNTWRILAKWYNQTDTYWPGLFHCYADPRIPATSNDIERLIKDMKQLERVLSRNPRPAARFILNAPTNSIVTSHPELPGAELLAQLGPDALRHAEAQLRRERKRRGVGWRAIRNFEAAKVSLKQRWDDACKEADAQKERSTSGAHAS